MSLGFFLAFDPFLPLRGFFAGAFAADDDGPLPPPSTVAATNTRPSSILPSSSSKGVKVEDNRVGVDEDGISLKVG